jgi:hypothetical protein
MPLEKNGNLAKNRGAGKWDVPLQRQRENIPMSYQRLFTN